MHVVCKVVKIYFLCIYRLRDKEREYRVQRKKLEREINHLKHQLKTKQYRLGEIAKEKQ